MTKPSYIYFSKTPFPKDAEKIPLEKFIEMLEKHRGIDHFEWTESILRPGSTSEEDEINPILESLVICDMGPDCGWGVFARKMIPENTLLGKYAGRVVDPFDEPRNTYQLITDGKICISAKYAGNIVGMFQHLPNPSVLGYFPDDIATANTTLISLGSSGEMALKTNCTVLPGKLLGWDYSWEYWDKLGQIPMKFNRQGQPQLGQGCILSYMLLADLFTAICRVCWNKEPALQEQITKFRVDRDETFKQFKQKNTFDDSPTSGESDDLALQILLGCHQDILYLLNSNEQFLLNEFCKRKAFCLDKQEILNLKKMYPNMMSRFLCEVSSLGLFKGSVFKFNAIKFPSCLNSDRYHITRHVQPKTVEEYNLICDRLGKEAMQAFKTSDFSKAISLWQEVLRLEKDFIRIHELARELPVVQVDNQIFRGTERVRSCYWNLGNAYNKLNNGDEAVYCLRRAVRTAEMTQHPDIEKHQQRLQECVEKYAMQKESSSASTLSASGPGR